MQSNRRLVSVFTMASTLLAVFMLFPQNASAQDPVEYFRQRCQSCHTIGGGRLTGPDLKNVAERKDHAWHIKFLMNPKSVLDSGDAYALKLKKEARGAVMTNFPDMTKPLAESLLRLIAAESKLEKSQFKGTQISMRPFTPDDVAAGRALFNGETPLTNGGPSCVSCHSTVGMTGLGGGYLGPDLTDVFGRLGGRKALGAWLSAPATTTMQPVFKNHPIDGEEILPLLAYFKNTSEIGGKADMTPRLNFFILGLLGALAVLMLFDVLWRKRFRAVRAPMVKGEKV